MQAKQWPPHIQVCMHGLLKFIFYAPGINVIICSYKWLCNLINCNGKELC
jgi:hypothetical protein